MFITAVKMLKITSQSAKAVAELHTIETMIALIRAQERVNVIKQIEAFAGDYHHHIDGRDVVIVQQLLDFLKPVPQE
jgi:hypothetical protein